MFDFQKPDHAGRRAALAALIADMPGPIRPPAADASILEDLILNMLDSVVQHTMDHIERATPIFVDRDKSVMAMAGLGFYLLEGQFKYMFQNLTKADKASSIDAAVAEIEKLMLACGVSQAEIDEMRREADEEADRMLREMKH
jgi:hypothetical protein